MTFIEFIGFIITMLAFFFLVVKQARDERKRRQNPDFYEEEERKQQDAVRDLLKSLHIELPEEMSEDAGQHPPPPPPPITDIPRYQKVKAQFVERKPFQHKTGTADPYAISKNFGHKEAYSTRKKQQSGVKRLLGGTSTLKDAVILKEVLDKPKGLQ